MKAEKTHVISRGSTDEYSVRVTTICGRSVPRSSAVRYKSALASLDYACKQCRTRTERTDR